VSTGGSLGGLFGALIGDLAARHGWGVSQDEAAAWGVMVAVGVGTVAHLFAAAWTGPGLLPAFRRGLHGPDTKK
jgi:hypothetical protein